VNLLVRAEVDSAAVLESQKVTRSAGMRIAFAVSVLEGQFRRSIGGLRRIQWFSDRQVWCGLE
jgi:hypothetical protein